MEYKLEKANMVANVLSRKAKFTSRSNMESNLLERVKKSMGYDVFAKNLLALDKEGNLKEDLGRTISSFV